MDTYGPVWEASSAAVSGSVHLAARWLGWWSEELPSCPKSPESCRLLIVYLSGYRLLAVGLTGLSGILIASMVRRNHAALVPLALAAWLLNPLTLIATAVGGHNDAVMLALALLGWWFLQRQRPFLGLLVIILAAHVKLTALIWLPACVLWIIWRWGWRRGLLTGLASAVAGLGLSWLVYAPFGGWQTLPRMLHERSLYFANSPWRILNALLIERWGWQTVRARSFSVGMANWLFAAGALLIPLWSFNFRPKRWRASAEALVPGIEFGTAAVGRSDRDQCVLPADWLILVPTLVCPVGAGAGCTAAQQPVHPRGDAVVELWCFMRKLQHGFPLCGAAKNKPAHPGIWIGAGYPMGSGSDRRRSSILAWPHPSSQSADKRPKRLRYRGFCASSADLQAF